MNVRLSFQLVALMFSVTLVLNGCVSVTEPNAGPSPAPTAAANSDAPPPQQKVEVIAYWGQGAEQKALQALVEVFNKQNPTIQVETNVKYDGSTGDFDLLFQRLDAQQPPDTWTVHAGKESLAYVIPGQLEPITAFFDQEGFDKVMPPLLLEQLKIKGEIYTVPVNIHRSNMLWYNPKVFQANHLQPPRTLQEFFAVAQALEKKGITPLALGGTFEIGHLFESILLATYGAQDYVRLTQGDPVLWADERLPMAVATMKKVLGYASPDRSGLNWTDTLLLVKNGKAGMTIMGDWAEGYLLYVEAKPDVDFAWAAAPGTDGAFMWLSDSFGLAKGAPHRDAALAWLRVVGSKQGQDTFNPLKGSIPARIDADKNLYDEYAQWSIDEFRNDELVPSIVHGAAVPNAFRNLYSRALIDFSRDLDEQALIEGLKEGLVELER